MNQTDLDALWTATLAILTIDPTQDCLDFHTSWHRREGGTAMWNSLNTTWLAVGATDYNSVHVKNYPYLSTGAHALASTLRQGYYASIVAGLRTGKPWDYLTVMSEAFRTWSGGGYTTIPIYHSGVSDMTPQESTNLANVTAAVGRLEVAIEDPTGGLRAIIIEQGKKIDQLLAKGG